MATNKNAVKPGKNGYKIIFNENMVVMNYKFAAAAAEYGTKEYKIMKGIRRDFPGMAEVVVSGRDKKTPHPNTRLTYENMEIHINAYENANDLLEVFETVKALSKVCASPYKYVCDWFEAQFPDYKSVPIFQDNKLTVLPLPAPSVKEYKKKLEQKKTA